MPKKHLLLKLARETLENYFENKGIKIPKEVKEKFSKQQACFVTLTKNKQLRGCIGSIYPRQELWKDVIENTKNAAFQDPRFPQLTEQELEEIKIEISILTFPKKLEYSNEKDLLIKINKKQGLILKKGFFQATYLPQVWKQLPNKEDFLSSLCIKASLPKDEWKKPGLEIYIYEVEKIKE